MRSSIACVRCRRSKVKCVNNGVGTVCRACDSSGRECVYPSPAVTGIGRRRESNAGLSGAPEARAEGERKVRARKSGPVSGANSSSAPRDSPRPLLDAFDSRILTPQVWQELFDIFQVHYAADLPFLHPPTFLKPLRQASAQPPPASAPAAASPSVRPPGSDEFLLAFLALTARFHPRLVAHHSPPTATRPSNPLISSEYYAMAANERLTSDWIEDRESGGLDNLYRLQAMLMLGLHEWGMCRGSRAWLRIGKAIRGAQAMGLQYERDLDDEPMSRSLALTIEAERLGVDPNRRASSTGSQLPDTGVIDQEVRRRTFWSCFIMDRYLSSGKYRPQMLQAKELRIQLPASERSFLFAERVRTLLLGDEGTCAPGRAQLQSHRQASILRGRGNTPEPDMASAKEDDGGRGRLEVGADEGLVSRYIKILEVYGKVMKWSCAGGRRTEEIPPWDFRCEYNKLLRMCLDFKAGLPRQHVLTTQNTQAHLSMKTSTPYLLVHTVYLLCLIMLHREYVPFIPLRCSKPEGPLDPPTFPPEKYDVPAGFWEDSARQCFKAARDIMDLVRSCQEWNALVETPIVGFAIYTVAFVGVYCINFPWMDPEGYMSTPQASISATQHDGGRTGESKGFEAARKALEMIGQMRVHLHMANGWFTTITRMHKYFRRMKFDYRKNVQLIECSEGDGSPMSTRHLSLREGGAGGGLNEWKILERTLHDFGNLEDQDVEMNDISQRPTARALEALDDGTTGSTGKSEDAMDRPALTSEPVGSESGPWNAINTAPNPAASHQQSLSTTPSSAQFRSYEAHLHHLQPPGASIQQPAYGTSLSNFRPLYSHDTPATVAGMPPSLKSPASHSASSISHPSPPFDRQGPYQFSAWTSQNATYPSQHAHTINTNGSLPTPQVSQHSLLAHDLPAYPTPAPNVPSQTAQTTHHLPHASDAPPQQQQSWHVLQKEAWLSNVDTRLSGDDLAAFADGGELAVWANMAASRGMGQGWLSALWTGAAGTQ